MNTIWKFRFFLASGDRQIEIPAAAQPVHVDMQDGVLCLWVLLCPSDSKITRTFHIYTEQVIRYHTSKRTLGPRLTVLSSGISLR